MTPSSSTPLQLESTTGRRWTLTPIRPLSPSVQQMRAAGSDFAVKTLTLQPDELPHPVLADADAWREACRRDPLHVVALHDVVVKPPHLHYIMQYCPRGDISTVRSETSALRCLAAAAAGLEAVLATSGAPHANLSTDHFLLDAAGNAKLAGFGQTRVRRLANPKRTLSESDDVRALGAILFEMIYGLHFDPSEPKLPETPRISSLTADLLRAALYRRLKDVPSLPEFRYDIAAARGLLPPCTPALPPISQTRREDILDIDLNSSNGSQRLQAETESATSTPKQIDYPQRADSPDEADDSETDVPQIMYQPTDVPNLVANPLQITNVASSPSQVEETARAPLQIDLSSDASIDDFIRYLTKGNMQALNSVEADQLIESCAEREDLPDKIFKVLFRLPISKNPLVAFKAITVIHRLIAEGPAKLTALAITNDGFLNWIESSWSRERLQNKTGKLHMYAYCFCAGEISWYTALLRRRILIHGRIAHLISTHWVPRADGRSLARDARRDAVRLILEVTEKCGSILRKVVAAKDPAAEVKRSAVPFLVAEINRTYHVICWLYATSEDQFKSEIYSELEIAHNATRMAMAAVKSESQVLAGCAPNTVLSLSQYVPESFDVSALMAALRKKKKKKKKKKGEDQRELDEAPPMETASVGGEQNDVEERARNAYDEDPTQRKLSMRKNREKTKEPREKTKEPREKTKEPRENGTKERSTTPSRIVADQDGLPRIRNTTIPPVQIPGPAEVSGLQKLSISVRRGGKVPPSVGERVENGPGPVQQNQSSARATPNDRRRKTQSGPNASDEDTSSSDGSSEELAREKRKAKKSRKTRKGRVKKERKQRSSEESSGSEYDSEDSPPPRAKQSVKKKKKKKKKQASKEEVDDSSGSNSEEAKVKPVRSRKKAAEANRSDEKAIPFDKEHPMRRRAAKKQTVDTDYQGGSKEALEAAAKGRKTPSINPKFEVAPYEVNFGPQIGSGGFGVVYKAKFRSETVAVKKIHGHALSNAASVGEFQSEVAVLCTLSHPNILRFVGACTRPPNLMIITEFMGRGTLFDLLHQTNTRVTWPMRKKFALDTCHGMRYLHDSKLLHRDLKSSNLMIDKDFNCKVGDFGLTRISKGSSAIQMTGQCGTFQYMAVEVLANKPYSEKADVFSFGILLWEMVARKLPYFGMQPMQVGIAVVQQGLRPTIPAKCPEPLAKLMRVCWDNDPNRRPSFAQLILALEAMPE